MDHLQFTLSEVVSLIGIVQCVYVIVHVCFRAGSVRRVILPVIFFLSLSFAFLSDLAFNFLGSHVPYYDILNWVAWASLIPLSVLLVFQMSDMRRLPSWPVWLVLLTVPLALLGAFFVSGGIDSACYDLRHICPSMFDWLRVLSVVAGAFALLLIWGKRNLFADILEQPAGQERYWLILSLIMVSIAFLVATALVTTAYDDMADFVMVRGVLGLGFVYLVSTSMFRIYPSALFVSAKSRGRTDLSDDEQGVVRMIDQLITLDKVYHESGYSRSDLARELNLPEGQVSRVISLHYKKSFPRLLNENRVEDAKRLLLDTDAAMVVIAKEVGFNSISSFNRVFKEIEGRSPSDYRQNMIK